MEPTLSIPFQPNEKILWQGKPNMRAYVRGQLIFWPIALLVIFGGFAFVIGYSELNQIYGYAPVMLISVGAVLVFLILFIWHNCKKESAKTYTVTNQRILNVGVNSFYFGGLPTPYNIPLSDVTNVFIKHSLGDRFSGNTTGTVNIETPMTTLRSAKGSSKVPFALRSVDNPNEVMKTIINARQS